MIRGRVIAAYGKNIMVVLIIVHHSTNNNRKNGRHFVKL